MKLSWIATPIYRFTSVIAAFGVILRAFNVAVASSRSPQSLRLEATATVLQRSRLALPERFVDFVY